MWLNAYPWSHSFNSYHQPFGTCTWYVVSHELLGHLRLFLCGSITTMSTDLNTFIVQWVSSFQSSSFHQIQLVLFASNSTNDFAAILTRFLDTEDVYFAVDRSFVFLGSKIEYDVCVCVLDCKESCSNRNWLYWWKWIHWKY